MQKRTYAGIGSRETPKEIMQRMVHIGSQLGEQGWILRSGGARGADTAFEVGCDLVQGAKEIFLPFEGFNNNNSPFYQIPDQAFDLIDSTWKDSKYRSKIVRQLFARNCQQVLGQNLDDPTEVIICWTPGGKHVGGTSRAIRIAQLNNVPVVNLFDIKDDEDLFDLL